jgi:hypothetical protein
MAEDKNWIVTASGEQPVEEVTAALEAEGFTIGHVFDAIGSISCSAPEDAAERARALPGVADVAPDTSIDIGPPGDSDTW